MGIGQERAEDCIAELMPAAVGLAASQTDQGYALWSWPERFRERAWSGSMRDLTEANQKIARAGKGE